MASLSCGSSCAGSVSSAWGKLCYTQGSGTQTPLVPETMSTKEQPAKEKLTAVILPLHKEFILLYCHYYIMLISLSLSFKHTKCLTSSVFLFLLEGKKKIGKHSYKPARRVLYLESLVVFYVVSVTSLTCLCCGLLNDE